MSVATSIAAISEARLSEEESIKTHCALKSGFRKLEGLSIRSAAEIVAKRAATIEKDAWSFMYIAFRRSGLSRRNHATATQLPLWMRLKSSRVGGVTCVITARDSKESARWPRRSRAQGGPLNAANAVRAYSSLASLYSSTMPQCMY